MVRDDEKWIYTENGAPGDYPNGKKDLGGFYQGINEFSNYRIFQDGRGNYFPVCRFIGKQKYYGTNIKPDKYFSKIVWWVSKHKIEEEDKNER